tara:strand:+ start:633 stop:1169 length:537 start_codon:yes stop_codon:yes gene_type:complete
MAIVLIESVNLTTTTTVVEFSNIPQDYTHLKVVWTARVNSSPTNPTMWMTINNDTSGSGYTYRAMFFDDTQIEGTGSDGQSSFLMQHGSARSDSITNDTYATGIANLANYTKSGAGGGFSSFQAREGDTTSSNRFGIAMSGGVRTNTSAVTNIKFRVDSISSPATLVSGSSFQLYGIV